MGKRQTRILRKNILQHKEELLQRPSVQLVLQNRVVLYGPLQELTADQVILHDLRENKHVVPLNQVEEIIYDREAAY